MSIGKHEKPNKGLTDTWLTPEGMVKQLGDFDLDPCEHEVMPYKLAKHGFNIHTNGLNQEWFGRVWMNPPYSKNDSFAEKFMNHNNGIALVFARTETKWFQRYYKASSFLFLNKRIIFNHANGNPADGNAGAPSVLIACGDLNDEYLKLFSIRNGGLFLKG